MIIRKVGTKTRIPVSGVRVSSAAVAADELANAGRLRELEQRVRDLEAAVVQLQRLAGLRR